MIATVQVSGQGWVGWIPTVVQTPPQPTEEEAIKAAQSAWEHAGFPTPLPPAK